MVRKFYNIEQFGGDEQEAILKHAIQLAWKVDVHELSPESCTYRRRIDMTVTKALEKLERSDWVIYRMSEEFEMGEIFVRFTDPDYQRDLFIYVHLDPYPFYHLLETYDLKEYR